MVMASRMAGSAWALTPPGAVHSWQRVLLLQAIEGMCAYGLQKWYAKPASFSAWRTRRPNLHAHAAGLYNFSTANVADATTIDHRIPHLGVLQVG